MRVKVVPEPPPDLETLGETRRAVPLVPAGEEECVARLMDRREIPSQDAAREWLTFLAAVCLIEESDTGFRRTRDDIDRESVARQVRERVYGLDEVLGILREADGPLAPAALFERFAGHVPAWERHRHADPEAVWRERIRRLVGWAALCGLVEETDRGYRVRT